MSVAGRDWEAALGRLTRARFKVAKGLKILEGAQSQLVDGEDDEAIYTLCRKAERKLDMAVGLLRELRRPQIG